jgi:hypothetical protein
VNGADSCRRAWRTAHAAKNSRLGLATPICVLASGLRRPKPATRIRKVASSTATSPWTDTEAQGGGGSGEAAVEANARRPPGTLVAGDDLSVLNGTDTDTGKSGVAHLVSRPIDTSKLPWYQKLLIKLTGGSHAGWIFKTEDGAELIQSGPNG